MTPRSLGVLVGAAALVAAASFALGRGKKSEQPAIALEEERFEISRGEGERLRSAPEESALDLPKEIVPKDVARSDGDDSVDRTLAEVLEEELEQPTVRELHWPVIRAIREKHSTPEARKEAMLKALRASGPTGDAWAQRGREVFEQWERSMPTDLDRATLRETVACYQAGCEIAVRFASREDAERGADAFRELQDASSELHAGRVQTPAVDVGGGAYEANWIMLRPEDS